MRLRRKSAIESFLLSLKRIKEAIREGNQIKKDRTITTKPQKFIRSAGAYAGSAYTKLGKRRKKKTISEKYFFIDYFIIKDFQ
jgi:hypothetical protein